MYVVSNLMSPLPNFGVIVPNPFAEMPPLKLLVRMYKNAGERLAKRPDKPPYYTPSSTYTPTTFQGRKLWNDRGEWIGSRPPRNESYFSRDVFREELDTSPPPRTITVLGNVVVVGGQRPKRGANFPGGNLQKHDYLYWIGERVVASAEATCRVCHKFAFGSGERKRHFEFGDCGRIMVEAAKRFQANKDKFCACGCGKPPGVTCWGLGFKEEACEELFAFEELAISPLLKRLIVEQQKLAWAMKGLG